MYSRVWILDQEIMDPRRLRAVTRFYCAPFTNILFSASLSCLGELLIELLPRNDLSLSGSTYALSSTVGIALVFAKISIIQLYRRVFFSSSPRCFRQRHHPDGCCHLPVPRSVKIFKVSVEALVSLSSVCLVSKCSRDSMTENSQCIPRRPKMSVANPGT